MHATKFSGKNDIGWQKFIPAQYRAHLSLSSGFTVANDDKGNAP